MPQLVRGGKYVFGWSRVSGDGRIVVPPEALEDYQLLGEHKVILMSGSRTSGGFGLTTLEALRGSKLSTLVKALEDLANFRLPEGETLKHNQRFYCWVHLRQGVFMVPLKTLECYGIKNGDYLLSARGSGLAIGFLVRGPIVNEAGQHSEIPVFER